jgi:CBS domain-containing protein
MPMFEEAPYVARDLMTRDVAVVHPETPLRKVVQIMTERHVSGLPVVDAGGALVGMLTEGDLVRWREGLPEREERWLDALGEGFELAPAFVEALRAERHTVKHAMSHHAVVTIPEDMPARQIASRMHAEGVKRMPVVRDGKLVGIVARSDLVRGLAQWLDEQERDRHRGELPTRPGA